MVSIIGSITPVAARRFDVSKGREINIDDRCRAVLEALWECCEPVGVLSLQSEQYADGIAPTLWAATAVGRRPCSGDGSSRCQVSVSRWPPTGGVREAASSPVPDEVGLVSTID